MHRVIRERLIGAANAARDHDAYWSRPSAGWRSLRNYAMAAARTGYVAESTAEQLLDELVGEGLLERRGDEWRLVEAVVPVGGDERMVQR